MWTYPTPSSTTVKHSSNYIVDKKFQSPGMNFIEKYCIQAECQWAHPRSFSKSWTFKDNQIHLDQIYEVTCRCEKQCAGAYAKTIQLIKIGVRSYSTAASVQKHGEKSICRRKHDRSLFAIVHKRAWHNILPPEHIWYTIIVGFWIAPTWHI